jgi:ketosteroid isomerase-like protein
MWEENVEVIRRIYDAWDKGESPAHFMDAGIEYVNPSYAVEPGTRRGRKSFAQVQESYEDFTLRVDRVIDAGTGGRRARFL